MTRKEAIAKIKAWDFLDNDEKEVLETLIPELAESEDERIRKELIGFLVGNRNICNDLGGININKTLTWLEKQGE